MVTTSCPEDKLITALKWLNYGYSEEGLVYWNYGTEGETFILDDNGIPQWTDLILNDADGLGLACAKYTGTNGTGISIQQSQQVRLRNSQESVDAVYKWIENTNAQQHFMPPVGLTEEMCIRDSAGTVEPHRPDGSVGRRGGADLPEAFPSVPVRPPGCLLYTSRCV